MTTKSIEAAEKAVTALLDTHAGATDRRAAVAALETTLTPTEEEVEAAARALWEKFGRRVPFSELNSMDRVRCFEEVRAALRAAALARLGRTEC